MHFYPYNKMIGLESCLLAMAVPQKPHPWCKIKKKELHKYCKQHNAYMKLK